MTTPRSFRARIALLSALLSGVVLLAFGVVAWVLIYRANLRRVDEELRAEALQCLTSHHHSDHWREAATFGDRRVARSPDVALMAKGTRSEVLYQSDRWPAGLSATWFPAASGPESEYSRPDRRLPPGRMRPPGFGPPGAPMRELEAEGVPPPMRLVEPRFSNLHADGRVWRVVTTGNPNVSLAVAVPLDKFQAGMREIRNAFAVAFPAALWIIALGAWLLAQRALRPLRALTVAAEGITAKGLSQRIPHAEEDAEFARLITVFNQMMARLEGSFQQAVRFSADAAHELKTPLTILQGELEQGIQRAEPGSDQQALLGHLLEEVQRLKTITRKLLLLSLADSGQLTLNRERFDLGTLVDDICEDIRIVAPGLALSHAVAASVVVEADEDLLRQVVQNLVVNAVRHNRPAGAVAVELIRDGSMARLLVRNTGEQIPTDRVSRVFERFYRASDSRERTPDGGTGLGLSLAREIARAHGGDVTLEENEPDSVAFALTVPLAP